MLKRSKPNQQPIVHFIKQKKEKQPAFVHFLLRINSITFEGNSVSLETAVVRCSLKEHESVQNLSVEANKTLYPETFESLQNQNILSMVFEPDMYAEVVSALPKLGLRNDFLPYIAIDPFCSVSVTALVSSFTCLRRTVLSFLVPPESPPLSALIGTALHFLFQSLCYEHFCNQKRFSRETLSDFLDGLLLCKAKELAKEVFAAGLSLSLFREKCSRHKKYLLRFYSEVLSQAQLSTRLGVTDVLELFSVEEPFDSALFGLTGVADLVFRSTSSFFVVELKALQNTRGTFSAAYQAQAALYQLLSREKLFLRTSSLSVFSYLHNILGAGTFERVTVTSSLVHSLLDQRNLLVHALFVPKLPPVLPVSRMAKLCSFCPVRDSCFLANYLSGVTTERVDIEEVSEYCLLETVEERFLETVFFHNKGKIKEILTKNFVTETLSCKLISVYFDEQRHLFELSVASETEFVYQKVWNLFEGTFTDRNIFVGTKVFSQLWLVTQKNGLVKFKKTVDPNFLKLERASLGRLFRIYKHKILFAFPQQSKRKFVETYFELSDLVRNKYLFQDEKATLILQRLTS